MPSELHELYLRYVSTQGDERDDYMKRIYEQATRLAAKMWNGGPQRNYFSSVYERELHYQCWLLFPQALLVALEKYDPNHEKGMQFSGYLSLVFRSRQLQAAKHVQLQYRKQKAYNASQPDITVPQNEIDSPHALMQMDAEQLKNDIINELNNVAGSKHNNENALRRMIDNYIGGIKQQELATSENVSLQALASSTKRISRLLKVKLEELLGDMSHFSDEERKILSECIRKALLEIRPQLQVHETYKPRHRLNEETRSIAR